MSIVPRSLSFTSSRELSHLSSGFRVGGFAVGRLLPRSRSNLVARTQPLRGLRVVRAGGDGQGEAYPAGEFEVASAEVASVALNQVAPPVGNVFGSTAKEVNVLEDPAGFFKDRLERKAQKVREAIVSVEEAIAPSPYSPAHGTDVVVFVGLSVFLALSFWLGNYVVPTWIFKETVFRNSNGNVDDNAEEHVQEYAQAEADKPSEEEVDPADLIELPKNLMPLRGAAVAGFKAGRQKVRDAAEKRRKKKAEKR